jgi:hypothetical protein
LPKYN